MDWSQFQSGGGGSGSGPVSSSATASNVFGQALPAGMLTWLGAGLVVLLVIGFALVLAIRR